MTETYEKQMEDAEIIFTAISTGAFESYKEAEQAVVMLYVPDMMFSRAGISHALKRLERHYSATSNKQQGGNKMDTHELKTDQEVYQDVVTYLKPFEIRFDDRGFKVGDILVLRETEYTGEEMKEGKPLEYTGRSYVCQVTYILRGPIYGLADGWVIMTITDI